MTEHIARVHEGKKLKTTHVQCDICKQKFSRKKTLTEHVARVHEGKKLAFPCNICGENFSCTGVDILWEEGPFGKGIF